LGALLRAAAPLGVTHPVACRAVSAIPLVALHAWALAAAHRWLTRNAPTYARAWLLALGLSGPVILFAGHPMSESIATAFLVVAVEALDRPSEEPSRDARNGFLGGLALGFAFVARYGSAPFIVAAIVWVTAHRRYRMLAHAMLALVIVGEVLGELDALTWGRPFHSVITYARYNVLTDEGARAMGSAPAWAYARPALAWTPFWIIAGAALALRAPSLPLVGAAAYVAALLVTPHKEDRFLYPAIVLFALAAAPALDRSLRGRASERWVAAFIVADGAARLLFPFELRGDEMRATVAATRSDETTGLLVMGENEWGTGGHFMMGRDIPLATCAGPDDPRFERAVADARFTHVVALKGIDDSLASRGYRPTERVGRYTVWSRAH
jgi:hypothetical protein